MKMAGRMCNIAADLLVLKVIDEHTIGFADFSGIASISASAICLPNDRISLILMDYREKRRLKIWGRADRA